VEIAEFYIGGLGEGLPGRLNLGKALIVVAAQHEEGSGLVGFGCASSQRFRRKIVFFVQDSVEPGASSAPRAGLDICLLSTGTRSRF
jgi:hypothetical protein